MGCTKLAVVLLTISLVQQLISAAPLAEILENAQEVYESGKGERPRKDGEEHDKENTNSFIARLTLHTRQKLSEKYDSLSPQEIHEKLKVHSPDALELMSNHIKEYYGDVDLQKLHEELKKTSPEQQQQLTTQLAQHIKDHLLNKFSSMSASELHQKLMSVSPKVSQHVRESLEEKLRLSPLHVNVKDTGNGISGNGGPLAGALEGLGSTVEGIAGEALFEHIREDDRFADMSPAEMHEKLMSAGPELSEHIKEKLGLFKVHENLKNMSPSKLELLEEKLGDHIQADITEIPLAELHDQLKAYSSQISEHIREKMSELEARRSGTKLQSRTVGDCVTDLRDIATQREAILKVLIEARASWLTVVPKAAQCLASGASTPIGTCLANVLTQFERTAQDMVTQTSQAFTSLTQDFAKLATCALTSSN